MQTLLKQPEVLGAAKRVIRCAIYTRVSTEDQAAKDFNSLDAQRKYCERFIASQEGWQLAQVYDDPGYSAKNLNRPGMQRLLGDIGQGLVDVLVLYRHDRLTRDQQDSIRLFAVCAKHGVKIYADGRLLDMEDPDGWFVNNLSVLLAQRERLVTVKRTRNKVAETRRIGKWTGGHIPLGYDNVPKKGLQINPVEAEQVNFMFATYLQAQSLDKALPLLNGRYQTKRWTTEKGITLGGRQFSKTTFVSILKNPIYTGQLTTDNGLVLGQHEAIVDQATFDRVQRTLAGNTQRRKSVTSNRYHFLLLGLTRCAVCGSRMTHYHAQGRNNKTYRYYKCSKAQHGGSQACPYGKVPASVLEASIVERLEELAQRPELLDKALEKSRAMVNERMPKLAKELRALEAEARKEKQDAESLMAAMVMNGLAGNPLVAGKLNDLAESAKQKEAKMNAIREEMATCLAQAPDPAELRQGLAAFGQAFQHLDPEDQGRMIRLVIQEVAFDGQNRTITTSLRPLGTANGGSIETHLQSVSQVWLPDTPSSSEGPKLPDLLRQRWPLDGPPIDDVYSFQLVKDGPNGLRMVREGVAA